MKGTKRAAGHATEQEQGPLWLETRRLMRRYHLRARKRLGQHFLVDEEALGRIVAAAELEPRDVVMEVGPGLGMLTRELAGRAGSVVAVELDDRLADILGQTLSSFPNVFIVNRSVLEIEPGALIRETVPLPEFDGQLHYKVVANLPYYITSAALRHFMEAKVRPDSMVVMVQKEVAEAIIAKPGDMSLLSVSIQFYAEPRLVSYVPAASFYPAPEVDSAVLRLNLHSQPAVAVSDEAGFFDLVRAGFSAARKQLVNSLAKGLGCSREDVLSILERAGISSRRRAETLSISEWAGLWRVYSQNDENADH